MPRTPLPTSTPSGEGVAAAGVLTFLDDLEQAPGVEPHSLMVLRHGRVVAQGWWAPFAADRPHHLYSLSKTFTSTAAGLAVAEGLLDLDETVVGCLPELDAHVSDPRSRAMRVRDLLTMSTGHLDDMWEPVLRHGGDPVAAFLQLPPERDPGSVFAYNQPATYTLAAILQRRTGQTLTDWLRPRVLDPLGVGEVAWQQYPAGRDLGFSGLHATTDAIARLGQLYLQGGTWDGVRLLPEGWVEEATRAHVPTPHQDGADWQQGYGYQVWRSRHGYRGDGAYGQFCLVLPEQDAVVAMTGQSEDMQRVLTSVWTHLMPALDGVGGTSTDDDAALAARLADLALPPLPGTPQPGTDEAGADGAAQRWNGVDLAPAPGARREPHGLTRVRVERDDDGWAVLLHDSGTTTRARLGADAWTVVADAHDAGTDVRGAPTATSGGWTDPGTLRLAVAFLETPHRLLLTCRLPAATVETRWVTQPLGGGSLASLQSSRRLSPRGR